MKFKKIDLLTLLISLFLFASCEKVSTIGLEVDPLNALEGDFVDTLSVASRTITDDPVITINQSAYPIGYLNDPIFGITESDISMSVGLPNSISYTFGKSPILDSAVLVLAYTSNFYGDTTLNYRFNVRQLSNNLAEAPSFMSNVEQAVESTILGTKATKAFPNTPLYVYDVVKGGADTLVKVNAQVRIKLDSTFFQQRVLNNTQTVKSNIHLQNNLKGLNLKVEKSGITGSGGMMFFDFSNQASHIAFYYRHTDSATNLPDTVKIDFPLGNTTAVPVVTSVKHDFSNTPVKEQLDDPTKQFNQTYLQPMAGLRNKISFPYLEKFVQETGKVIINKAELVIDLVPGSIQTPFEAPPRLSLYRNDIAERRANLPDNNPLQDSRGLDPTSFGGYYNVLKNQYIFVVTGYIQDLISGKTKDYGTFLASTPSAEFAIQPSFGTAARGVIGSHQKNNTAGAPTMKLNIYYTKAN